MPEFKVDIQFERKDFNLKTKFELGSSGQITVVLGSSGCGKSTLLRLLAGLDTPNDGKIKCDDESWFNKFRKINHTPQQRSTGFVFQDYALFENMTVFENIGFGVSKQERVNTVNALLKKLDLQDFRDKYPQSLSGGQKQRTALGRALAIKPKLLLLDEPLSAIDFRLRKQLQKELKDFIKAQECPVILVTHDLQEARFLADKIIVMANGKISRQGDTSSVFDHPINKDTANTLGWQNFLPIESMAEGRVKTFLGNFILESKIIPNAEWIAIKPENIHFSKIKQNSLKASVLEVFDMGAYKEFHCKVAEELTLVVQRPIAEPAPPVGSDVNLHLSSKYLRYINNSYKLPSCFETSLIQSDEKSILM